MEREVDWAGLFRDTVKRGLTPEEARRDVIRRRYGTIAAAAAAAGISKDALDKMIGGWRGAEKMAEARIVIAADLGLPEEEFFGQGQEAA